MSIDRGHGIATSSVLADSYDLDALISDTEAAKVAAQAAQAASELALDTFDDRYLGAKAADPTVDNDGNALIDGAMYFDTALNITKIYDLATTAWKRTTPTTADQTNIDTVSAKATEIGRLGTVDAVADMAILGTADVVTDLNTLGTADVVTDMNTLGTSTNVSNMNTLAGISSDVTTVSGISANVTTVAGISSDVTAVAGKATEVGRLGTVDALADITTLADIEDGTDATDAIQTVAGISANVTTTAGISANVTTVANNDARITILGDDIDRGFSSGYTDAALIAVSNEMLAIIVATAPVDQVLYDLIISTVDGYQRGDIDNDGDIDINDTQDVLRFIAGLEDYEWIRNNILGPMLADMPTYGSYFDSAILTISNDLDKINTVATDITNVNNVATNITNVNNVGGSITNVNEVANNIGSVNAFSEQYRVSATEPTTSLDAGDLWFDTTSGTMKVYDGSGFVNAASGGGVNLTSAATAPASPTDGDQWFDTTNGILYAYMTDGTDSQWLDISSANGQAAAGGGGAMELISTTVVSTAVSSVSFTSLADGIYKLIVHGQTPTVTGQCYVTPKDSTGATPPSFRSYQLSKTAGTASAHTNTYFRPNGNQTITPTGQEMFIIDFMVKTKSVSFTCEYASLYGVATNVRAWSVAGSLTLANEKITGMEISHSAGNLASGSYSLYKITS